MLKMRRNIWRIDIREESLAYEDFAARHVWLPPCRDVDVLWLPTLPSPITATLLIRNQLSL